MVSFIFKLIVFTSKMSEIFISAYVHMLSITDGHLKSVNVGVYEEVSSLRPSYSDYNQYDYFWYVLGGMNGVIDMKQTVLERDTMHGIMRDIINDITGPSGVSKSIQWSQRYDYTFNQFSSFSSLILCSPILIYYVNIDEIYDSGSVVPPLMSFNLRILMQVSSLKTNEGSDVSELELCYSKMIISYFSGTQCFNC